MRRRPLMASFMVALAVATCHAEPVQDVDSLVHRMLAGLDGPQVAIQLYRDEIAAPFPIDLPNVDGSTVVGSMIRKDVAGGNVIDATAIVDLPEDGTSFRSALQDHLQALGWTPIYMQDSTWIVCTEQSWPYVAFIFSPLDTGIELRAMAVWSNGANASPCSPSPLDLALAGTGGPARTAPHLAPPDGASVIATRVHPDPIRSYTSTRLRTQVSAPELLDHFEAQLIADGWVRLLGASDAPIAWSAWEKSASDQRLRGTLTVFVSGRDDERTVYFDVIRVTE